MFKIEDGREQLFQWDIDRRLIVRDAAITEVHFCNRTDECSLVCETYVENGQTLVNIPNILLQTDWRINVYAYDKNYTKHYATFNVVKRTKPADYVYTETEVLNYNTLLEMINNIEGGNVDLSDYYTKTEVDEKLSDVDVDLTDYYNKEEVDEKIDNIELTPGAPGYTPQKGVDYFDGKDGYTPVKGVDYFDGEDYVLTETDKQEIAGMVDVNVDLTDYALKSDIPDTSGFTTEEKVNELINTALGVIENGTY